MLPAESVWETDFYFLQNIQTDSGVYPDFLSLGTMGTLSGRGVKLTINIYFKSRLEIPKV